MGMQSTEAIKTSLDVDVDVPMVLLDARTPKEWEEGVNNQSVIKLNMHLKLKLKCNK